MRFSSNEIIFREDDEPDYGYLILVGEVEVSHAGSVRVPTVLHPGDVFGEIGVMIGRARHHTARAMTAVTAMAVSHEEFVRALNDNLEIVAPFFSRLFRTLHEVDGLLPKPAPLLNLPAGPSIRVFPSTNHLMEQMELEGLQINEFPFRVGRKPSRGETLPPGGLQLLLEDDRPFNLSRRHFAIETSGEGPLIRDTGSHLGTIVNGQKIGGHLPARIAHLQMGENKVVARMQSSPFVFNVLVEAN